MSSKVNCTCGWSWNKSDSSKKDMYICHECGRDNSNNMKNGGWLDNYNDSQASAPEGMKGDGFSNVGRNYSPAWGGQFQEGGEIPQAQNGLWKENKKAFVDSTLNANKNLDFVKRLYDQSKGSIQIPGVPGRSTHYMADDKNRVYPTVVNKKGKLQHLKNPDEAWEYADKTGEYINFKTPEQASWFANSPNHNTGYKMGTNVLTEIPRKQMGGSLPGATGNMYARIGAPSKGPRRNQTDVTDASAQNGKEMQYYQEGLDFTPKTISKNGGWLDGYDVAQDGKKFKLKNERLQAIRPSESTFVKKPNFEAEQAKERKTYIRQVGEQMSDEKRRAKLTKDQREREDYNAYNEERGSINKYTPETTWNRTKAIVSNPMTAIGYKVRGENLPGNFQAGPRSEYDYAVDWVNPLQGAVALSEIPGELGRGEYMNAGLSALDALDLGVYAKVAGKALGAEKGLLKNLSKSRSVNELKGSLVGIPPEKALPRLSSEELKIYRQVQDIGRMRATGKPISEQYKYALEQGIPEEHLQKIFKKSKSEIETAIPDIQEQEAFRLANPIRDRINLQRSPRRTSTSDQMIDVMNSSSPTEIRSDVIRHSLSDYGSDSDIEQLLERVSGNQLSPIPEELIINTGSTRGRTLIPGQRPEMTLGESFNAKNADVQRNIYNTIQSVKNKIVAGSQNYPYYEGPVLENVPSLSLSSSGSLKNVSNKVAGQSVSNINSNDVFTGSLNTSHSSYLPQLKQIFKYKEGVPQFLGYKPMNSLGFLSDYHYPSKDIAKYLNTEIDTQISRGIIPKDIQRPYVNGENVLLPHYGIKQFREGGVIKDDRGQWGEHKGEPTRINQSEPESYIDMGPDPLTGEPLTQPLLGVSDKGERKIMYPGEKHKYKKGTKYVDEFPIAKNGLRQEQKGLQNLDNLLNFTNYNKPQPGSWLNKYN